MPLQATSGAASYDAFGGGAAAEPNYIESVFQTYLYTGNGSTQTITNGIDLSTKGGLTWIKERSGDDSGNAYHCLFDTARGVGKALYSNVTLAQSATGTALTAFNTTGFSVGTDTSTGRTNDNNDNYVSWSFAKAPKFFDIVTYTGNGNSVSRNISHSLGSVAGTIIVKRTDSTSNWAVAAYDGTNWKVGTTTTPFALNLTNASTFDVGSVATSTTFNVCRMQWSSGGNPTDDFNTNGATYVAYLFAHNAGGFGLTGTDNVISCGSFTTDGSGKFTANIGYEPQWIMIKRTNDVSNWSIFDNMRGMPVGSPTTRLLPNTSDAESSAFSFVDINATGFAAGTGSGNPYGTGDTYIYIAIRRGPMKVPTSGTSVFSPNAVSTDASAVTTNFPVDFFFDTQRTASGVGTIVGSRLQGNKNLVTNSTSAEAAYITNAAWSQSNTSITPNIFGPSTPGPVLWNFQRAPSFFDEVCYTGTGSNTTFTHNLGAVPEMMIFKRRDTTANWRVYHSSQPASDLGTLNSNIYFQTDSNVLNSTAPTSSVFTVGTNAQTNASGGTYVAYLFATTAGVSKVGSYTGTGTTLQINCGFTGGSRFVLIKRVDDSADWYVWDSARGIVAGNDSYLLLNSTAAEVTNTDYIDTYSAGFEISSTAPAAINASGGTFVFLAIA